MFFPETDHENEIYHPGRQDSTHTISRRMSLYHDRNIVKHRINLSPAPRGTRSESIALITVIVALE